MNYIAKCETAPQNNNYTVAITQVNRDEMIRLLYI